MSFENSLTSKAAELIELLRRNNKMLATAESCTGGLIAALITSVAGSSDVFDAGFVTYSNAAKTRTIGVPRGLIESVGAVSEEVARAMATGALARSSADISIAVTGIAGPGGGSALKPVGLVYCAAAHRDGMVTHRKLQLGNIGRDAIRNATVAEALEMIFELAQTATP